MAGMGHRTISEPAALLGRRVRWCGPPQHGFLASTYRTALAGGDRRPPTAAEQPALRAGDEGVITELVATTAAGAQYALRFDSGYELEVVLPSTLVDVATTSHGTQGT